jgi:hypothetical protein
MAALLVGLRMSPLKAWRGTCKLGEPLEVLLSKLLRGAVAGWGATKLGGRCLTTILFFILLW